MRSIRRFSAFFLTLCLLLSACGGSGKRIALPAAQTSSSAEVSQAPTKEPTEALTEAPTEAPTEVPTEEPTEAPTEAPTEMPTEPPENLCANLTELRDYLCAQREGGSTEIDFIYTGGDELPGKTLARMLSIYYVSCSWEGQNYHLRITPYPGDNIVQAWRSGDDSALTDEEKATYSKAQEIVAEAVASASSLTELERALHDWICRNVCYVNADTEVDPDTLNRPLTAVGALLDGEANCQGYTDAFYLLGTLAGLTVSRMSVNDSVGGHMINTIQLLNAWYIVDVTYDDNDEQDEAWNYRLFNAGLSEIQEYTWPEEYEYHPIAESGGYLYFYNLRMDGYDQNYQTIDEMAVGVLDAWLNGGAQLQYVRLIGTGTDWSALSQAIKSEANRRGLRCSWTIWSYYTESTSFFMVKLTAK